MSVRIVVSDEVSDDGEQRRPSGDSVGEEGSEVESLGSPRHVSTPADRLGLLVTQMIDSMEAVSEVARFAKESAAELDDLEKAVERIAGRRMPNATPEQHRAAAGIIRESFKRARDARRESLGEGAPQANHVPDSPAVDAVFSQMFDEIQGLADDPLAAARYVFAYAEATRRPARIPMLNAALLTTAVSNFEVLVSGVVREFLALRPQVLRSDEARYSLQEIEGFESLAEFREYCADRYAEGLLRGSFEDWMEWFEKRLKIGLNAVSSEPDELKEVFQRRHLFIHNGGRVNRLYLLKVAPATSPPEIGKQLAVDHEYLERAIDLLTAAGILLTTQVMRRLVPSGSNESHPSDDVLSTTSYDFLTSGRYELVVSVATPTLDECSSDYARLVLMVNRWIALKHLVGVDAIRADVDTWQTGVLQGRFQLAKLALLDKTAEAYELGQKLLITGELQRDDWDAWPLLAEVRAYEAELVTQRAQESNNDDVGHGTEGST